jgi:hypothetical protein
MNDATVGFAGVLLGALITSGVEIGRARRTERQELRAAVRRLSHEFGWASGVMTAASASHDWGDCNSWVAAAKPVGDSVAILARSAPYHVWARARDAERETLVVAERARRSEDSNWEPTDDQILERPIPLLLEAAQTFQRALGARGQVKLSEAMRPLRRTE